MTDDPYLEITVTDDGATLIVRLDGELDLDTVPELKDVLAAYADRPASRVVVDLAGLRFCDSSGLGALIWLRRRRLAAGGSLDVVSACGQVAGLFAHTGLAGLFGMPAPAVEADASAG